MYLTLSDLYARSMSYVWLLMFMMTKVITAEQVLDSQ